MKIALCIGVMCALVATPAMAVTISFADSIIGVDSPAPAGWSTDDSEATLAPSYSLLGGNATVSGSESGVANNLSHRLTRGLGVSDAGHAIPVESDEVDNFSGPERITIKFNSPYIVNSIEVRSLFYSDHDHQNTNYLGDETPPEQAFIDFYRNGVLFHTEDLTGTEFLGSADGDAEATFAPGTGLTVDELVFRVPTSADLGLTYTTPEDPYIFTDFAVAKLDVTPAGVPEPLTTTLGLMGLAALGWAMPRRRFGR